MTTRPPTLLREQSPPYSSLQRLQQEQATQNGKALFEYLSRYAFEGTPLGVCRPVPGRDHPNYEELLAIFLRNLQEQLAALHGKAEQIEFAEEFKDAPYEPAHFFALANVAHEIVEEYVFREFDEQNAGKTPNHLLDLGESNPPLTFVPITIDRLQTLTALNFRGNHLTELPSSLYQLRYLEVLDMSDNQITRISEEIRHLVRHQEVNFSNNQIRSISRVFMHLSKLLILNLANNQISEFNAEIAKIGNLEILHLSCNRLTSFTFGFATRLKFVNLSRNPLTDIQRVFQLPEKCYIGLRATRLDVSQFTNDLKIRGRNLDISVEVAISQGTSKKRSHSETSRDQQMATRNN